MDETNDNKGMTDDVEQVQAEGYLGVCGGRVGVVLRGGVV